MPAHRSGSRGRWDELFPAERKRAVRLLVKEPVLSPNALTIRIRTNGLRSVVAELRDGAGGTVTDDAETLDVPVPMELRRPGGRQMILTDGEHPVAPTPQRDANQMLIKAVAKAHRQQE